MNKYLVRDREAGNVIEEYTSYFDALAGLKNFENIDRDEGTYTPNFYEIVQEDE